MSDPSLTMHPQHTILADGSNSVRSMMHFYEKPTHSSLAHDAPDFMANLPRFDVRETTDAYFLEGEFPGIQSKDDLVLEWSSDWTLTVSANIQRLSPATEWGSKWHSAYDELHEPVAIHAKHDAQHHAASKMETTRTWLFERTTGNFLRSFTFAHEVNQDGLRAKLEQELLKVLVPKSLLTGSSRKLVQIE